MRFLLVPLVLALSACSLTPELVRPEAPIPQHFDTLGSAGDASGLAADLGWRAMFRDPRLQKLIELSLVNNRDLRLATLNVAAIQAQFRVQDASRLPAVSANAATARERSLASGSDIQASQSLGVALNAFEIDLFGRLRALSEAAFARYLASDHGRRAAQITLVAGVADAYFSEQVAQSQRQLAEQTLLDWRQSLDLALRLKRADQSSGLDVAQAEGQVATAEADLDARERTLAQARNALRLLVGTDVPADFPDAAALNEQPVLTDLPAGLSSDLLARRPDILQAEQSLAASNADIGAARAAFFPRLSLTASLGIASPAMSGLFNGGHGVWQFSPQITQPLFQGGALRAELRLAEVRKSSAIAEYERTIQTAFREVSDGLAGKATYGRQIKAQSRAVDSAELRLSLTRMRYLAGLDGRLEFLDAQRTLSGARQTLLDLRRDEIGNAIALYKALGGGLLEDGVLAFNGASNPQK